MSDKPEATTGTTTTVDPQLLPCPLCGGTPRLVKAGDFHLSFAIYDDTDDSVCHNFLHSFAITCEDCDLTLPSLEDDLSRGREIDALAEAWNMRVPA